MVRKQDILAFQFDHLIFIDPDAEFFMDLAVQSGIVAAARRELE